LRARSDVREAIAEAKPVEPEMAQAIAETGPVDPEMADILAARANHTVVNGEPETPPEPEAPTEVAPGAELIGAWEGALEADRRALFEHIGLDGILNTISDDMRRKLQARFRAVFESRGRIAEHATEDAAVSKKARRAQAQRRQLEAARLYAAPAASQAKN
jgi:hypothetical protein